MIVIENGTINININIVFKQDCPELFLEILYIMFTTLQESHLLHSEFRSQHNIVIVKVLIQTECCHFI